VGEPRPKLFEYSIEIDAAGGIAIPGAAPLALPAGWTADHLLLAALVRCSIASLAYHAKSAGHRVETAAGSAAGKVTRRESDGRYAFVEIDCRVDAKLTPPAVAAEELTAKAERDCFIGATLTVKPRYEWRLT
jgi:organic hydroperoxide reductase OsmC/OhrA